MINKFLSTFKKTISSLENSKVPFIYFILTVLFAATLRTFLEIFSDHTIISSQQFIHYVLFYVILVLSIILLFHLITKTAVLKVAKVVFPSVIIVIIPPLFDLVISLGKGFDIGYFMPGVHTNLLLKFFTFFGEFSSIGPTPGIKIEIAIVLFVSFIYLYLKTSKLMKSLFGTVLLYTVIFLYFMAPFILRAFFLFIGIMHDYSNSLMISAFLSLVFIIGTILAYFTNKEYFKIIFKDIRPFRLLHFEFMFVLGVILGLKQTGFNLDIQNSIGYIFIPISIVFAWLYSVMSNNIEDYNIDKISNKQRPLINSRINFEFYTKLAWFFLIIALVYAFAVNFKTFFIILLFIGNYFLYSMQPLRLKRVLIMSKLLIAINSLILVIAGFLLITNTHIRDFSILLISFFLIGFTLVINFIDIKDYKGDKKEGILTLPVLLGLKKSKLLIGIFFILMYLSAYFIIEQSFIIIPLFIFGIIQFYLVNKKNYNEKYIFLVYLFSLILLFIHLILF